MPDDMPPALLVERFDIRAGADDQRLLAMEDFCSVLDLSPEDKYDGTIERVARALRGLSTSPDEDLLILMKRVVFARVFPRLEHDRMALKLNGKDERLKRADFLSVSAIAGLRASDTNAAIDDVLNRLQAGVAAIRLPTLPGYGPSGEAAVSRTLELCRERIAAFA